jgi:hypothetical protein
VIANEFNDDRRLQVRAAGHICKLNEDRTRHSATRALLERDDVIIVAFAYVLHCTTFSDQLFYLYTHNLLSTVDRTLFLAVVAYILFFVVGFPEFTGIVAMFAAVAAAALLTRQRFLELHTCGVRVKQGERAGELVTCFVVSYFFVWYVVVFLVAPWTNGGPFGGVDNDDDVVVATE